VRRLTSASSTALGAATLASILLLLVLEASRAGASLPAGSPSQGTFTEGRAGPNEPSLVDGIGPSGSGGDGTMVTASVRASGGDDVVRVARSYIGTKYGFGTCTRSRMSCTCLTKKTFAKFGSRLPTSEDGQWSYEPSRKVAKSELRPGDVVFFKEAGRKEPITHVGIYSGNGNLIQASRYFGKVVESKMSYIKGYSGAKRLKLANRGRARR
jgi:cell wall-associated NlpC family hydrolase